MICEVCLKVKPKGLFLWKFRKGERKLTNLLKELIKKNMFEESPNHTLHLRRYFKKGRSLIRVKTPQY